MAQAKRFSHEAIKTMSPETREKGRQFVAALLDRETVRDLQNFPGYAASPGRLRGLAEFS